MNMSVEMIEKVYELDVTIMPTRYSTADVPDIVVFFENLIYRFTWTIGAKMGWMCVITENEFKNIRMVS